MNEPSHTLSKTGMVDCALNSWHAFSDCYSEFAGLRLTNSRLSDIIGGPTTTSSSPIIQYEMQMPNSPWEIDGS